MPKEKIVYVVHGIDTEGPLHESLSATFERLRDTFDINLTPSYANLQKLRNQEIDLDGRESVVAKFLDPSLLTYNETWDHIDRMLARILAKDYRNQIPDSFGGGWVYNWFCLDHVGFEVNPRGKDLGYHNVYDRYMEFLDKYDSHEIDEMDWHFHPLSTYREAHRCATSYENSPHLHPVLCRKIIERNFFPSVFRAGFHVERPDCHWFLEQWIPFDGTNLAVDNLEELEMQNDLRNGRFGDWRRAPSDWSVYHPDFYDYQIPGQCRRSIARFLNINTRFANITQEETDKAFRNAQNGMDVILGLASHDYRELSTEVDMAREMIQKSSEKYPDVKFKFCRAKNAFNQVVNAGDYAPLELDVSLYRDAGALKLKILTESGEVFGPQPYLAIKTKSGRFIHDNLDFGLDQRSWHYVFDADSILDTDVDVVGVAANNKYGHTFIKNLKVCI